MVTNPIIALIYLIVICMIIALPIILIITLLIYLIAHGEKDKNKTENDV